MFVMADTAFSSYGCATCSQTEGCATCSNRNFLLCDNRIFSLCCDRRSRDVANTNHF